MHAALDSSVLFHLGPQLYAFSAVSVSEMVSLTTIHEVPDRAPCMRGLIDLRGSALPVLDLRLRLGMHSATEELEALIQIFDAREQDHRHWIQELDASIRDRRPFGLTTDPTQCAFGKWYGALKTDNVVLDTHLRRIDRPHRAIHELGAKALARQKEDDFEGAAAIAADIRDRALPETVALMHEATAALREAHREVAVVVQTRVGRVAVIVDGVEAVEALRERDDADDQRAVLASTEPDLTSIRRRVKDDTLVIEIDVSQLMMTEWTAEDAAPVPASGGGATSELSLDF